MATFGRQTRWTRSYESGCGVGGGWWRGARDDMLEMFEVYEVERSAEFEGKMINKKQKK